MEGEGADERGPSGLNWCHARRGVSGLEGVKTGGASGLEEGEGFDVHAGVMVGAFPEAGLVVAAVDGGAEMLRKSVDGEGDGVELLLGVERLTLRSERPEDAAKLPVDEMREQIVAGTHGGLLILGIARSAVSGREPPEDTVLLGSGVGSAPEEPTACVLVSREEYHRYAIAVIIRERKRMLHS